MEKQFYREYYELERSHWWFTARLIILEKVLRKQVLKNRPNKDIAILNAGVATGATTTMLEKIGNVTSLEYDQDCCDFLKEINIDAINASLTELPFEDNSFDLVCAFDVVEHIENHQLAIQEIKRVLKKDGIIYLTVPAYMFLWSHHDVVNHHFRRYTKTELVDLLKNENIQINYSSYFNFFMFFPIFLVRMLSKLLPKRKSEDSTGSDVETLKGSKLVNTVLHWVFEKERFVLQNRFAFPFGVSCMVIGQKD